MKRVWIVIPLMLFLSLGGCAAEKLPDPIEVPSAIEGTWMAAGPDGEQAVLDLHDDGTMGFANMPAQIVRGDAPWRVAWSDLIDRDGTWSVKAGEGEFRYLSFVFSPGLGKYSTLLLSLDHNASGWFVTYPLDYDDDGFRLDFEKVEVSTSALN